ARAGEEWPWATSRKALAQEWLSVVTGQGPQGWSPMTHVNEGGLTPQKFVESLGEDDPEIEKLPKRIPKEAPLPKDIPGLDPKKCVDVQDDKMGIAEEGRLGKRRVDHNASDYLVVWMPGWHHEWACQIPWKNLPQKVQKGRWKVYAVIKVEKKEGVDPEKEAIWAGVYNWGKRQELAEVRILIKDTSEDYRSYLIGTVEASPEQYIWIAPPGAGIEGPVRLSPGEGNIKGLWVDRVILVPAE
ncbi:MAG: hypothetical protein ACPL7E_05425, partial [bacterium]